MNKLEEYRIISREELDQMKEGDNPPIRVSVSRLNEHRECPGKTYFTHIKPSPEDQSLTWPQTLWGTTLHSIIEQVITDPVRKMALEAGRIDGALDGIKFLDVLENTRRAEESNSRSKFVRTSKYRPEEMGVLGDKWVRIVLRYLYRSIDFASLETLQSELPTYVLFPDAKRNMVFTGIIDLAVIGKDSVRVIDLKTTSQPAKWYVVDWRSDIQSNSYRWVIEHRFQKRLASFSYLIVAAGAKMLINQTKSWEDSNSSQWMIQLLGRYRKETEESWDQTTWKPLEKTCMFCAARMRCPRSMSRKKW